MFVKTTNTLRFINIFSKNRSKIKALLPYSVLQLFVEELSYVTVCTKKKESSLCFRA